MGGAVFLFCWLFGLRRPSTRACRLLGGARSLPKWWPPGELTLTNIPSTSVTSVLFPTVSHTRPPPPQETLQDLQVGLIQALTEALLCPGS